MSMSRQENTMTKDPVCGMTVEPSRAAAHSEFEGKTFYFCCVHCQRTFDADPRKYAASDAAPAGCGGCGCKAA